MSALESISNQVYSAFTNIIKFTEYSGSFGGRIVTPVNALALRADVTMSENYNMTSNITQYPVYHGADISDHVRPASFSINVTCITSDASMSYFDIGSSALNSGVGEFLREGANAIGGALSSEDSPFEAYSSKSQDVFSQLRKWWDEGTPLSVDAFFDVSGFKDFAGSDVAFAIESLSIPRTPEIGSRAIKFNLTLRMIRFAYLGLSNASILTYDFDKGTKDALESGKSLEMRQSADGVDAGKDLYERTYGSGTDLTGAVQDILK